MARGRGGRAAPQRFAWSEGTRRAGRRGTWCLGGRRVGAPPGAATLGAREAGARGLGGRTAFDGGMDLYACV